MTIEYIENDDPALIEMVIDGGIGQDDLDRIGPRVEAVMKQHERVKLLEIVRDVDLRHIEPSLLMKSFEMDGSYLHRLTHCAVVSDQGWLGPIAKTLSALSDIEVRVFEPTQATEARQWLEEAGRLDEAPQNG